ncbi:MAG: HPr family phosphocarrier protein [Coriobacteriaceae bacterium]|nr:HPr family phosphocarrier protein [Coriobacteriaceae bacterium]
MVAFSHVVLDPAGFHARPVAAVAAAAREWESEIELAVADRRSSARDLMGLMALDARRGDEIAVTVAGPDEREAARALQAVFTF